MSRPLYDRIRDPDPYVRLYALIEVARLREETRWAMLLANAMGQMFIHSTMEPDGKRLVEGEKIEEARALLARYRDFKEV